LISGRKRGRTLNAYSYWNDNTYSLLPLNYVKGLTFKSKKIGIIGIIGDESNIDGRIAPFLLQASFKLILPLLNENILA
jgi:hypothetical protein